MTRVSSANGAFRQLNAAGAPFCAARFSRYNFVDVARFSDSSRRGRRSRVLAPEHRPDAVAAVAGTPDRFRKETE